MQCIVLELEVCNLSEGLSFRQQANLFALFVSIVWGLAVGRLEFQRIMNVMWEHFRSSILLYFFSNHNPK